MKRLNTKLDEIERRSGTDGALSIAEKTTLVEILARLHALFWAWRWCLGYQPPIPEIRLKQREYLAGIVGITVKASGKSDWQTAHGRRQSLIASGHLTAAHGGGQISSMFLTPLGQAVAIRLVGDRLHSFHPTGRIVLAMLRILIEQTGKPCVAETVLWGRPCYGDPNQWNDWTEMILPCLVAGLVRVEQDTTGRIIYIPVDGVPEPPEISVDVQADDAFDELYLKAWQDERATLERCEPRDTAEIFVPLPANYPFNFCDVPTEKNDR